MKTINNLRNLLIFLILYYIKSILSLISYEYDLPILPTHINLNDLSIHPKNNSNNYTKKIPRNIWIAVKDEKDPLPHHLNEFFAKNNHWNIKICGNACKDHFMNTTFAGTSNN
jgi:hypothetical protein